jgi:hypothetical protein
LADLLVLLVSVLVNETQLPLNEKNQFGRLYGTHGKKTNAHWITSVDVLKERNRLNRKDVESLSIP